MARHVVLLRRDPSLGLALRALLHGTGRVTELRSVQAWSTLRIDDVNAVVVDVPASRRIKAIEEVRSRFSGPVVVVLDPFDDAASVSSQYRCWVLQRPFEIVDLWHHIESDALPEVPSIARPRISPSLRVFLCHSSHDKPAVRELYFRLRSHGIYPWLDEVNLVPGQDWELEIRKAIRESHIVLVCLSRNSIDKVGYLQKEIRIVLDLSDQQPEGTIFLVPVRLEACEVPDRLHRFHWVNLYDEGGEVVPVPVEVEVAVPA